MAKRTVYENNTVVVLPDAEETTYDREEQAKSVNAGGTTAERPSEPYDYQSYFDTDLDKPIWYNGTSWVDATGADPDV